VLQPSYVAFLLGELKTAELLSILKHYKRSADYLLLRHIKVLGGRERQHLIEVAQQFSLVSRTVAALHNRRWTDRELAATHLGILGIPSTVPELTRLLTDRRQEVRYTAARSLAQIGTTEAFTALLSLLRSGTPLNRPRLLEIVQDTTFTEMEPVRELLLDDSTPLELRLLLIELVGNWRDHRMVETLREMLLTDDVDIICRTMKALILIGDSDSLPYILQYSDDPRWEVRALVARAIGKLDFGEATGILRQLLSDEGYWVRRNAAEALAELGADGRIVLDDYNILKDRFASDIARYQLERAGVISVSADKAKVLAADEPTPSNVVPAEK
jgi:HEAT repeat protein